MHFKVRCKGLGRRNLIRLIAVQNGQRRRKRSAITPDRQIGRLGVATKVANRGKGRGLHPWNRERKCLVRGYWNTTLVGTKDVRVRFEVV